MPKRYYFDETCMDTVYPTLWDGMLNCEECTIQISENYFQHSNRELDDLITEICGRYIDINIRDNTINFNITTDSSYYYYDFEKDIKKLIKEIEQKFNINIINGEFNATEVKYQGDKYKYTIIKNNDNSITLKKKLFNWTSYEKKDDVLSRITKKIKNIKI